MLRQHLRRRADSGTNDRHIHRAIRAVDVPCKQLAPPATVKKDRGRLWKVFWLYNSYGWKSGLEILPVLKMGVQDPLCEDI